MAQYYGTMKGNKGETSRLGSKKSGLRATCNGWDLGASVSIFSDYEDDSDVVDIVVTGGTNSRCKNLYLGSYWIVDGVITKKE